MTGYFILRKNCHYKFWRYKRSTVTGLTPTEKNMKFHVFRYCIG
jgi:hypothetical protein